ncbi:MAG: undecaprenyl-diphosphatase UppP [Planctomycetia bacterium]|nr:undecaprenyl-diphosphatase UppP [Planctomycetia bacterium]
MTLLQAIILGIVQGLTEWLPISSTAHLRIVPALLDWPDPGAAFTAVIQLGTLAAVVIYFWSHLLRIGRSWLLGVLSRQWLHDDDARMGWMMILGTVPIVICGLLFQRYIKTTFRSLYVIAFALIGLALVLAVAEAYLKRRQQAGKKLKELHDLGWNEALGVGFAQAVALIPGSSRSGTTMTGGLFLGLSRETAARFSFLLSFPSVLAAGIKELIDERHVLLASQENLVNLIAATVVSGIVGYASIAFLIGFLKRHTTYIFIIYRLLLGGVLLYLLWSGNLAPLPPVSP